MSVRVLHGDCLAILPTLEAESVHAVVTDPPYHLTSIVKRFGNARSNMESNAEAQPPNRGAHYKRLSRGFMGQQWDGGDIAAQPETWAAVLRVMKPGAHLVAFGGTRTFHRMTCAIEDAGFEIRDCVMWLYGAGFPKSHDVSKGIAPATPGGAQWDGWGTALKPAWEPIVLARRPLRGTVAANVLAHGCGALNIDACRIPLASDDALQDGVRHNGDALDTGNTEGSWGFKRVDRAPGLGRWPANVCHDGSDEVEQAFAAFGESAGGSPTAERGVGGIWAPGNGVPCGPQYGDSGSASRFFFCGKATAEDRAGSRHPTVKPLALMDWLVKLVTPPNGTVLDPFAGSGTTLLAADRIGLNAIGIEQSAEYVADIHRRLAADAPLLAACAAPAEAGEEEQLSLFDAA